MRPFVGLYPQSVSGESDYITGNHTRVFALKELGMKGRLTTGQHDVEVKL